MVAEIHPPIFCLPQELHEMVISSLHELDRLSLGLTCQDMYNIINSRSYDRRRSTATPIYIGPATLTIYPRIDEVLDCLPEQNSELSDTLIRCFRSHHAVSEMRRPGDLLYYTNKNVDYYLRAATREATITLEPDIYGRKIRHQLIVLAITFLIDPWLFASSGQTRRCIACSAFITRDFSDNIDVSTRENFAAHEVIRRWFVCKSYPNCYFSIRRACRYSYVRRLKYGYAPTLGLQVARFYWGCQIDQRGFSEEEIASDKSDAMRSCNLKGLRRWGE